MSLHFIPPVSRWFFLFGLLTVAFRASPGQGWQVSNRDSGSSAAPSRFVSHPRWFFWLFNDLYYDHVAGDLKLTGNQLADLKAIREQVMRESLAESRESRLDPFPSQDRALAGQERNAGYVREVWARLDATQRKRVEQLFLQSAAMETGFDLRPAADVLFRGENRLREEQRMMLEEAAASRDRELLELGRQAENEARPIRDDMRDRTLAALSEAQRRRLEALLGEPGTAGKPPPERSPFFWLVDAAYMADEDRKNSAEQHEPKAPEDADRSAEPEKPAGTSRFSGDPNWLRFLRRRLEDRRQREDLRIVPSQWDQIRDLLREYERRLDVALTGESPDSAPQSAAERGARSTEVEQWWCEAVLNEVLVPDQRERLEQLFLRSLMRGDQGLDPDRVLARILDGPLKLTDEQRDRIRQIRLEGRNELRKIVDAVNQRAEELIEQSRRGMLAALDPGQRHMVEELLGEPLKAPGLGGRGFMAVIPLVSLDISARAHANGEPFFPPLPDNNR